MQTSLGEQINAIQIVRLRLLHGLQQATKPVEYNPQYLADCLNDAGSTIAALNLNPDIFEKVSKLEKELHECRVFLSNVKPTIVEALRSEIEKDMDDGSLLDGLTRAIEIISK